MIHGRPWGFKYRMTPTHIIIALLIVFVALVTLANLLLGLLPDIDGTPLTLQRLLGWVMAPLVWLIGIPWQEAQVAGALMGIKTIAEYVESEAILEKLAEMQIDYAQGYEIMRPQSMGLELKQLSEHTGFKLHTGN